MEASEFRQYVGKVVECVYDNGAILYCRVLKLNRDGTFEYRATMPPEDTRASENPKGFVAFVKKCHVLERKNGQI